MIGVHGNASGFPSVTLGLGSGSYQATLADSLLRRGMLRREIRFGQRLEILDPDGEQDLRIVRTFPYFEEAKRIGWGVWRRLPGCSHSKLPAVVAAWKADRIAARWIPPSDIFHGCTAVSLASLYAAKRMGAVTVVETAIQHARQWQQEVLAECDRFGYPPKQCDSLIPGGLIDRMEREYEAADEIIVLSSAAKRSFAQRGYDAKTIVVWPGVDASLFHPPVSGAHDAVFRICYVGRLELAKGLGYLLEAWDCLRLPYAELLLVGEVRDDLKALLAGRAPNITLAGVLPPDKVAECYRRSNLFVFPSVNEGLALVVLEAMASGLPVIATDKSGAEDCITHGVNGYIVPSRNVEALAGAIVRCFEDRAELPEMGRKARAAVEQRFTIAHYEERQFAAYCSLAPAKVA